VHKEANKSLGFCKQSISRCSLWGQFQVLERLDFKHLKFQTAKHAASDFHRLSADVFKSPQFMLAPMATQHLKACSDAGRKAAQDLVGRVDDAVSSGAAHSTGQLAAPGKEALQS